MPRGEKQSSGVVEINGRRYDAATGRLLSTVKHAAKTIHPARGQVLDGFTRRPTETPKPSKSVVAKPTAKKRPVIKSVRSLQASQTMMRSVVNRPSLKLKRLGQDIKLVAKKRKVIDSARAFRAKTVARHPNITHFMGRSRPEQETVRPLDSRARSTTMAITRPAPNVATISAAHLENLLDQALARADAHRQALKLRTKGPLKLVKRLPRWLTAAIILTIILAVGSFFAWRAVPQLSLKVASSRAHVDASVPGYIPYGFSMASPVHYKAGAVNVTLKSSSDSTKSVIISQKTSNLDSESLKNSVASPVTPVQTSQVNGTAVYIYGKNNDAVFKKGNSQVTIHNNAQLPADELSNIAKGILEQ